MATGISVANEVVLLITYTNLSESWLSIIQIRDEKCTAILNILKMRIAAARCSPYTKNLQSQPPPRPFPQQ